MLTLGVGWCNFWHRHRPPAVNGPAATVRSAPPINITPLAYIQQSLHAAPDGGRTDLYRNSYRILKKIIYNSNKTFETSLTTIRRSRYDLDKITQTAPASRNLFISQSYDRAWESYPATYVHTLPEDYTLSRRGRGAGAAAHAARPGRSTLTDIH